MAAMSGSQVIKEIGGFLFYFFFNQSLSQLWPMAIHGLVLSAICPVFVYLALQHRRPIHAEQRQHNLYQLHMLLLPRTTIDKTEVPSLLSRATSLNTLHLGMAYRWQ